MSDHSKIEWTDHTFNPWWGCARVSPGCAHCYAESFAKRYGHDVWGKDGLRRFFSDKHWNEPVKWNAAAERAGVRARVFCASMADVFEEHPALPPHRERLWDLIGRTPSLDWQLLTKRPENIAEMLPAVSWPNVWLGTTVEDQERAETRIPELLAVPQPVAVRFLSCEPLLGPVDLTRLRNPGVGGPMWSGDALRGGLWQQDPEGDRRGVQWLICGGESGPGARPMHPQWARDLRDQAVAAGVPFFFKQWGEYAPTTLRRPLQVDGVLYVGEWETVEAMRRKGKKAAGRVLDGRTWDAFPSAVALTSSGAKNLGNA